MKKILGLVAAATMMFSGVAFAEGYINANDLKKGEFFAPREEEDGFVLNADEANFMAVDTASKVDSTDGDIFVQRINLKGSGKGTARSVSFPAKKGEKITVYGGSSSKTDSRVLNVKNEAGEIVKTLPVGPTVADSEKPKATKITFTAPADDTYYVSSAKSGCYIYQIIVEK